MTRTPTRAKTLPPLMATLPLLVAAPKKTLANNMQELVSYAKANPGVLTFASAGNSNTSRRGPPAQDHQGRGRENAVAGGTPQTNG